MVRREEIQRSLYGFDDDVTPNAVDAAISRLRKRLRAAGASVEIAVLRGVGCMLEARRVVSGQPLERRDWLVILGVALIGVVAILAGWWTAEFRVRDAVRSYALSVAERVTEAAADILDPKGPQTLYANDREARAVALELLERTAGVRRMLAYRSRQRGVARLHRRRDRSPLRPGRRRPGVRDRRSR